MLLPVDAFRQLPNNLKGAVLLMLAAAGFALMIALIKLAGERLSVVQILFVRQMGMLVMLAPTVLMDFRGAVKTQRLDLQLVRIMLALVAMMCGFTAVVNMPLADATAIGFAKSFFVTIFAVVVLKETVGVHRWSAVALGFLGVVIMVRPGSDGATVYGLLAVTGAAAAGAVMVVIRLLSRSDQTRTILLYQAAGVGIVMVVPAILTWQAPTSLEWGLLIAIGFVSYFAQKLNVLAYTFGEASVLASLDYVRLLYATALGWMLFDTFPGTSTWVGAGIIVLASVYTIWRERIRNQRLARDPAGRGFTTN